MKNDNCKWFKPVKLVLLVLFIASIVGIAIFPFPNRNLSLHFLTQGDDIVVNLDAESIAYGDLAHLEIPDIYDDTQLVGLRIFGKSKTLRLSDSNFGNLWGYFGDTYNDGIAWNDGYASVAGADGTPRVVTFNDSFVEDIRALSKSFMQERIIYAGWSTCIFLLIYIALVAIKDWKSPDNWDNHSPFYEFKKFFGDIKKYRQYMVFAARADLKAEVANSYLNRLWWLLEPLFSMLVYVIVFGNIMGNNIKNYSTFIYSSILMWTVFNKTANYSVKVVRNNRDIVSKVYVPKFVLLLSDMILNMIKLAFSMIVLVPMLIIFKVKVGFSVLMVFPALAVMLLFAFGLGMILLHYGVYVDDLGYAVSILMNMLMFMSGIFYDCMTGLPSPFSYLMLTLNPVAMTIDTMRNALIYNNIVNLPLMAVWFVASVLLCFIGVHIVYKNENSYVKLV